MAAFDENGTTDPPLADSYRKLLRRDELGGALARESLAVLERDLPMIDLKRLTSGDARERDVCADAMASAASEWGFFQVINHGVGRELLEEMRREQAMLFHQPFDTKEKAGLLNGSYRWGNATATSLRQLSWSEAFHVPLASISEEDAKLSSLRGMMQEVADAMSRVAETVAGTLAKNLGQAGSTFPAAAGCDGTTCFLRLNRYPACPFAPDTFGMMPHTDSDFLTVLCQDQVGGLEIMKDSHWVAVKPHADALLVNVGDLFQAWSNNIYKSVEHKVLVNSKAERFSIAYFMCPSHDSLIGTCGGPSPYRPFTFEEYRRKVQDDVRRTGKKIGLPNFLKRSTIS
ncbi:gibberellin 2-beta-dioxygenase 6-like [Triticum dicoccoides]|uniref:gibberellin 2-beta-dioxygenase 6-like n=1 Tax=Triticum dicoccoides TaxID=85692 RepID=UPI001890B59B|nr:gibberellin 2-beta-dioxygenase 6-like [Triticum dicoccoides]